MRRWLFLMAVVVAAMPAAAQYQPIGGKNKIRYDTFDWKVYETPHFRISFYDREQPVLEKLASFAESSYDELARRLNFQILEPIPLIAYATHAEFEQTNIIVGFIPEAVGAFASPVRNRMVLPVDLPDRRLQHLIQHELTHIFQYEILFQGRAGRVMYARPPLWFMEGMASYYGNDEDSLDEMYMRDAAMSDMVPSVKAPVGGFFAYRFGHKVFEFIEEEYGEDAVRDFVFAFRGGFGGKVEGPFEKVFNLDPEQFDSEFRAWLRKKYAPFAERGNPSEFGRPFRIHGAAGRGVETSPTVSPSGELVAAFTTYKGDVDVALFGVPDRRLYKNLTAGYTTKYEYLIAQGLTTGPSEGRDLAFSPDGNYVAVFARSERSRSLLLLDALRGGIAKRYDIPLPVDQPQQPAYSPDGGTVAFHAVRFGQFDIFLLDLASGEITNLTDDPWYDAAPTFAPDGHSLVYTSNVSDYGKLVRISLDDPSEREELTSGPGNDVGASFSSDGNQIYFASDRQDAIFDVYKLDLQSRALDRITYLAGGALNPVPAATVEGERVGFQAFHHLSWDLYSADPSQGVRVGEASEPVLDYEPEPFVPAVSIAVNPDKVQEEKGRKLFIEDAAGIAGLDTENNFISQVYLSFSDQYGDRRLALLLSSVDTFSNFQAAYLNMKRRLQWGASVFDYREFYRFGYDPVRDRFQDRQQVYRVTAVTADAVYPLSRYYRVQGELGYLDRTADLPRFDPATGDVTFASFSDNAPLASVGLVGDTTRWQSYGPHQGSRWEADFTWAYGLSRQVELDYRKYLATSRRSEVAFRLYGAAAKGDNPTIFAAGGLDTVRGFPVRSLGGTQLAFATLEWRFPLIDRLDLAFLSLGEIRGRIFADVGMSCYAYPYGHYSYLGESGCVFMGEKTLPDGRVVGEDGRLTDGVASYGWGFTLNLFGLPMHWDFIRRWDFKESLGGMETAFWIGYQF
jgi:hypothetical protein